MNVATVESGALSQPLTGFEHAYRCDKTRINGAAIVFIVRLAVFSVFVVTCRAHVEQA